MVNKDEKDPSEKDVTFLDLFNPLQPRSPEDLMEERMAICRECPFFNPRSVRCRKCGCFMSLKTTLKQAKCPEGKW